MASYIGGAIYELISKSVWSRFLDTKLIFLVERDSEETDPEEGKEDREIASDNADSGYRAGDKPERSLLIMGTLHPPHASHLRPLCQLHASTQEDTSCT